MKALNLYLYQYYQISLQNQALRTVKLLTHLCERGTGHLAIQLRSSGSRSLNDEWSSTKNNTGSCNYLRLLNYIYIIKLHQISCSLFQSLKCIGGGQIFNFLIYSTLGLGGVKFLYGIKNNMTVSPFCSSAKLIGVVNT